MNLTTAILADPTYDNGPQGDVKEPPDSAPLPRNERYITELGSYAPHQLEHSPVALRCRKCDTVFEGRTVEVHENLRAHHKAWHPWVRVPAPPKATPVPRVRHQKKVVRPPVVKVPAVKHSCEFTIVRGSRRGYICGIISTESLCWRHRSERSPDRVEYKRLWNLAHKDMTPIPPTPCHGPECPRLVEHSRRERVRRRSYCSQACSLAARRARIRAQRLL